MSRMGLREYARHRKTLGLVGGSLSGVQKAIASGRITAVDGKVDSEVADAAWSANSDSAKRRQDAPVAVPAPEPLLTGEVLPAPTALTARPQFHGPDWPETPVQPENRPSAGVGRGQVVDGDSFNEARRRLAWVEVELREATLRERRGESINGEEARKAFREIGRLVAVGRRTVASEIAAQTLGLTDPNESEKRVRKLLEATDERIALEILTKYADLVAGHVEHGTGS